MTFTESIFTLSEFVNEILRDFRMKLKFSPSQQMNHYQIEVSPSTDVTVKYTQKQSSQHLLMSINVCFLSLLTFIAFDKPQF